MKSIEQSGVVLAALLISSLFVASCAGGPKPAAVASSPVASAPAAPATQAAPAMQAAPAPASPQVRLDALEARMAQAGSFARTNAASFSTFTLSNGIPVVLKRNTANAVTTLSLVLRGGSLLVDPSRAGIEGVMLRTLARGSASWPWARLSDKLDETSSSFGAESAFDYSLYTLTTLDRYFAELLPIWAGTLTEPGWAQSDFDRVIQDARLALKRKDQDPWATTATAMNKVFFAGHPYAAATDGTKESLAAMDLAAVKEYRERSWSANRLFVVAVGDFEAGDLRAELEKALGSIPDKGFALPPPAPSFAKTGAASLTKQVFPASKGVAYLRGDFAAPAPADPDWAAASLSMRVLSDLLFNVVRDKYGAVYTPGSMVRGFGANYGSISIFKTTVPDKLKLYLDEAVAEFAAGKAVSTAPGPDEGKYPRQTLAEALPVYKALFVNETYRKIATNAAVAGEIARSVVQFGDPRAWLLDVDRVSALTAADLERVIKTWFLPARVTWVALGPADLLATVKEEAFQGWGR